LEQRRVQANDRVKQVERQIRPPSKPMVIFICRKHLFTFIFCLMLCYTYFFYTDELLFGQDS
jgi:hypothetical protein